MAAGSRVGFPPRGAQPIAVVNTCRLVCEAVTPWLTLGSVRYWTVLAGSSATDV
jgi:hypothetical protein